jgi:hypothetical protein
MSAMPGGVREQLAGGALYLAQLRRREQELRALRIYQDPQHF